VKWYLNKTRKQ